MRDKLIIMKNQSLRAELRAKKRELNFFENVTRILTSTLELNKIVNAIMKKTTSMIGAKAWFIFLVDKDGEELFFEKTHVKKSKEIQQKFLVKIDKDITDWITNKGIPLIVSDISKEMRFKKKMDKLLRLKCKSLMCIPMKIKDRVIGVLVVVNKVTENSFTKTDLDFLSKLINYTTMAIERVSLYQKMEELTLTDDLTNLFNLRYLNRAIELEIERSNRYGLSFTLIFMDVDFLKKVNDQHGHLVGSKVLMETAQLLSDNVRAVDVVARYGGDEFVIVLPQTSIKSGYQAAERLRKLVEQHVFLRDEGYSIRITASFGVASYPDNAKNKEELFRIADEAMYRGKFSTKNIVYAAAR